MGSKEKETVLLHKAGFETELNARRAYLLEKGVDAREIASDGVIRKIRAKIREENLRLKAIAAIAARTEELAKMKAEKLAAPKKQKKVKEPEAPPAETGKEKKKKKKKASPEA